MQKEEMVINQAGKQMIKILNLFRVGGGEEEEE